MIDDFLKPRGCRVVLFFGEGKCPVILSPPPRSGECEESPGWRAAGTAPTFPLRGRGTTKWWMRCMMGSSALTGTSPLIRQANMFLPEKRATQNQTCSAHLTPHQSFACGKCQLPLKGKLRPRQTYRAAKPAPEILHFVQNDATLGAWRTNNILQGRQNKIAKSLEKFPNLY